MICSNCEIWQKYQRLETEVKQLRKEKADLEIENGKLKRRLALYESIKAPLHQKRHRVLPKPNYEKRFLESQKDLTGARGLSQNRTS
jgi:regulator of replication initiation timing